jgi:hypothetical protein
LVYNGSLFRKFNNCGRILLFNRFMPEITVRQKLVFNDLLEKIAKKEPWSLAELMVDNGYAVKTAHNPKENLTEKAGWNMLLSTISDEAILLTIYKAMLSDDTRSSLSAADMLLKLKDKYPAMKSKVMGLFGNFNANEQNEDNVPQADSVSTLPQADEVA